MTGTDSPALLADQPVHMLRHRHIPPHDETISPQHSREQVALSRTSQQRQTLVTTGGEEVRVSSSVIAMQPVGHARSSIDAPVLAVMDEHHIRVRGVQLSKTTKAAAAASVDGLIEIKAGLAPTRRANDAHRATSASDSRRQRSGECLSVSELCSP